MEKNSVDPIQLFRPHFHIDESLNEIKECLEKGWTGLGFKTVEFENKWKDYTGFQFAHYLNSATAGLHLAVNIFKKKYQWKDGDEIITTPLTFVSTNHAILYERLKPVFADTDEYLCLDPKSVESKISNRTRAIMFVGIGGNTGRLAQIKEICKKHKLILILDAAHMAGTKWKADNQQVGLDADATIFSFQAVKNLPSADSGMICFKEKEFDEEARKLSWLGIDKDTYSRFSDDAKYKWYYNVEDLGFKYHGNSVVASLCIVALKYLEEDNEYRRKISVWYDEDLKGLSTIHIVPISSDCIPSRHLYQILIHNRDDVMMKLNDLGIFPGVHYRDNTEYPIYGAVKGSCENAAESSNNLLSLPMHMGLKREDVRRIAETIKTLI